MDNKQTIVNRLQDVFNRWQVLLASLSEAQILTPLLPETWTLKDVVAHMYSWQQGSVRRMQAALEDRQPDYPDWWVKMGPDPEVDLARTNAYLYELSRDKPWPVVRQDWKSQFMLYLELTSKLPENDFLTPGRYTWMGKFAIADSSKGSLEHHEEHLETTLAWLKEHAFPTNGE